MVKVPGGSYTYRGEVSEHRPSFHSPGETVSTTAFYINKFEVGKDLWLAVLTDFDSNYLPQSALDNMLPTDPVEELALHEIKKFLSELSRLTGLKFSLPTEVEWEWAARGANESRGCTYAGTNDADEISKKNIPNELGLYNMSDGVWEMCSDVIPAKGLFGSNYYIWRGGADFGRPNSIYERWVLTHSDWADHCGLRIVCR